jgi:hypothetical protein
MQNTVGEFPTVSKLFIKKEQQSYKRDTYKARGRRGRGKELYKAEKTTQTTRTGSGGRETKITSYQAKAKLKLYQLL